jgi:hypothetical protein
MPEYRVYFIDASDHIRGAPILIDVATDEAAINVAASLVGDHVAVEVWSGSRFVRRLTAGNI